MRKVDVGCKQNNEEKMVKKRTERQEGRSEGTREGRKKIGIHERKAYERGEYMKERQTRNKNTGIEGRQKKRIKERMAKKRRIQERKVDKRREYRKERQTRDENT